MDSAPVPLGDDSAQAAQALRVAFFAMATLAELRESDTESHLLRVQRYVRVLADKLKSHPAFAPTLTPGYIDLLCASVPMYDMGTVGIPDRILLKPGRLAPEELAIMRTHTTLGFDALVRAEKTLGQTSPLLAIAKEITLSHQEKWDGNGYPQGLAGTKIPLSARILAVADVYDALISNKVYKQGVEHEAAVQVIFSERASHFDPDVVDAFIEVSPEFAAIAQKYADTDADMQKKIEYLANAIAENAEM
ncbi:MAG TPA: HD domain-containing phosphohydrolase [Rhodoferax sp.]|jgi:putative two-component system response regulator|nr:HD domain-containing phosphohydrolase [Rhodoferax sp.]